MRIMKFGGAVMKNPEGFAAITSILRQYQHEPLLLVVSAFSTVTRNLKRAATLAEQADEQAALALAKSILEQHELFASQLLQNENTRNALLALLHENTQRLCEYLRGVSITRELTARTLDAIMSYGEYFAVHIAKHYLQEQGFTLTFIDAADTIVTDNRYGSAIPDRELTINAIDKKLRPALHRSAMVITQGFVGRSSTGELTTMGMESSNLTATLLGELLGAREVIIWTDVDGVRSADPRYAEQTTPLPHLSYAQAYTAAINGVKLLHPHMIEPVQRASIPLHIRSAFEPTGKGTLITRATPAVVPPILSLQSNVTVLHIEHINTDVLPTNFATTLVRRPADIISYTVRKNSVSLLVRCDISEVRLHVLPADAAPHVRTDYALLSIIGETAPNVLTALVACASHLHMARQPLIELEAQPHVSRIAAPLPQAQAILTHLHTALVPALAATV